MSKIQVFQLPFKGSWFVFWGGDTKRLNHHHSDRAEKYALDLIMLDDSGKSFTGLGIRNEDYYAFGRDILAPAAGEVIEAVDGLRDNVPQKTTNNYAYGGNYVLIKHTENVYSCLQHLRQGSVRVKAGQQLKTGQKLGDCGNSGNSSEPHLHFHLQDNEILTILTKDYSRKALAKGVKAHFNTTVWRNGKFRRQRDYAPIRGDLLST